MGMLFLDIHVFLSEMSMVFIQYISSFSNACLFLMSRISKKNRICCIFRSIYATYMERHDFTSKLSISHWIDIMICHFELTPT